MVTVEICCSLTFALPPKLVVYEVYDLTVIVQTYELHRDTTGLLAIIYCLCKNKGADQLCSYCTADLRLCYSFLPKSEISSF